MRSGKQHGFTLIEILMAIFIFSIVISLAYSSFNASFSIINSASSQSTTYSMAKIAMERIHDDLESFYPTRDMVFTGHTDTINEYRADNLEFTSSASLRLHPKQKFTGYTTIKYLVQEDPETKTLQLFRSEQPAFTEFDEEEQTSSQLLLCTNLLEVAFDYQNSDEEEVTEWDPKNAAGKPPKLPERISISLRFADGSSHREEKDNGILFKTALILPVNHR